MLHVDCEWHSNDNESRYGDPAGQEDPEVQRDVDASTNLLKYELQEDSETQRPAVGDPEAEGSPKGSARGQEERSTQRLFVLSTKRPCALQEDKV